MKIALVLSTVLTSTFIVLSQSLIFPSSALAVDVSGIFLPDKIDLAGKPLTLNGAGPRLYTFGIVVYVAALYRPSKSCDEKKILSLDEPVVVRMQFKRDVSESDMRKAWQHYLKANAGDDWSKVKDRASDYINLIPGVKTGDVLTHEITKSGLKIQLGEKLIREVSGFEISRLVLATWIGREPTTEKLKQALLGPC